MAVSNFSFTLEDLGRAREVVGRDMPATPQYAWPLLAQRAGAEVWVKHENHTPTGAFKVRGGLVYIDELCARPERPAGLITATRGNHGQSIPFAASRAGLSVRVLVPEGNSVEKNLAMQAWGAELIVYGADFDEAKAEAARLAERDGLEFVPPLHPALVRGVATYAYEFLTACNDLHTVYVPIGMGSGICGLIGTRDLLGLETAIVGVVSDNAPSYALSFESGTVVETDTARTFADGVACRQPSSQALEIISRGA
jgi:threonine dehydratase